MPTSPYDIIETVLNTARVRLLDAIQSLTGDILKDAEPFTTVVVNAAWRRMQRKLAALGYLRFEDEIIISGLAPVYGSPTPDPATQCVINWEGYYNGNPGGTIDATRFLPQSLIEPMDVWERETTTTEIFGDMDNIVGTALPRIPQGEFFQIWQWRRDALWLPGSVVTEDIMIRYQSYLPDFSDISVLPGGPLQVVPIMQCLDPFSLYIVYEMAGAREDVNAPTVLQMADDAARLMAMRDSAGDRGVYKASEFNKMADAYTPDQEAA